VVASAVLALMLGVWSGSPALLATLAGSLVLGVLYSTGNHREVLDMDSLSSGY